MRTLVATALIAATSAVVVAGTASGAKHPTVTLRLTSLSGPQEAGTTAVLKDFEARYPWIKVRASYVPGSTLETIVAQVAAGNAPDLLMVYQGSGAVTAVGHLAKVGLLADLSNQPWVKRIPPPFRAVTQYRGKTYDYPADYSLMGLVYNRALFAQYGVAIPRTFNDLLAACDTFQSHGVPAIAFGLKDVFHLYFLTYPMITSTVFSADPNWAQKQQGGEATFEGSPQWHQGLSEIQTLLQRKCFEDNVLGFSHDDAMRMVASGKAAMTPEVIEFFATVKSYDPTGDFGMFAYPGTNNPTKNWIPVSAQPGFAITAKSKHQAEAKIFLNFFNSPKENRKFSRIAGGLATADENHPVLPAGAEPLVPYLAKNWSAPFLDQGWTSAAIQPAFAAGVQQLFSGQTTVDGVLKSMDAAAHQG